MRFSSPSTTNTLTSPVIGIWNRIPTTLNTLPLEDHDEPNVHRVKELFDENPEKQSDDQLHLLVVPLSSPDDQGVYIASSQHSIVRVYTTTLGQPSLTLQIRI